MLLCTGQLYSMEPERIGMEELPPEVQVLIIQALNSYKNLDDVIKAIKAMSLTNKQLNTVLNDIYSLENQKRFIKLIHVLAKKFNTTTESIAIELATPAAKKYFELGSALMNEILIEALVTGPNCVINKITTLIQQGADVNYTTSENLTPLKLAVTRLYPNIVKLLLNVGAEPNKQSLKLLEYKMPKFKRTEYEKAITIKKLFDEYIKTPSNNK